VSAVTQVHSVESTHRPAARSGASAPWGVLAVAGVITIVVGIVVVARPGDSVKALAVIAGIYLLVDSLLAFVTALGRHTDNREILVLHGIVALIVGLILVRHPLETVSAIALLFGIVLTAVGALRLIGALRAGDHVAGRSFVALAQLIAGVIIVSSPHIGYGTLAIIVGISLLLQGIGMVALAWSLRSAHEDAPVASYRPGAAL
jgi:uncharacterized membrane protein HdeD (DUF308 family)